MSSISKFGQETLLRTTKVVAEKTIDYVKQNVNLGFETKVASQSSAMKQQENNILGEESKIQASVQGAHKSISKATETLGLEAALLNQALNPPKNLSEKITNSIDRKITDAYYADVKKISDKYKATIEASDNLYDKQIKQYYKDIRSQSDLYSSTAETSQDKNDILLKKYYDSIENIVNKNLGGDWKNELKTIIKTQEYYLVVRGISLAFKTYEKTKEKTNEKQKDLYYKFLSDFSTFGRAKTDNTEYKIKLEKKDNFDTNNAKANILIQEKWDQDGKVFRQNEDTIAGTQSMWSQDPDFVNLKNKEGKYQEMLDYVNQVYIKYLTSELLVPEDSLEILPEKIAKRSQEYKERWDQFHSYDTISPEMRAAIAFTIDPTVDVNNLEAVQKLIAPNPLTPYITRSHNPEITKNYLENKSFVLKKEVNSEQTELKKGFTVIDNTGKIKQTGVTSPLQPYSSIMEDILKKSKVDKTGAYRFFFEKLHGRTGKGGFNKRNLITPKKKFEDVENRMVFPAYIEAYNDSYDVNWNTHEFSGRAENYGTYKTTGRTLSISFFMISDFSAEMLLERMKRTGKVNPSYAIGTSAEEIIKNLNNYFIDWGNGCHQPPSVIEQDGEYGLLGLIPGQYSGTTEQMWARMTFLAQCCYPWFRKDGKLKEQPLMRVRIGDFIDQVVRIKSLQFDEYEEFNMDLTGTTNMGVYPMGVKCVIQADIIHSEEPHSEYLKFYWRKDYDIADKAAANAKVKVEKTNDEVKNEIVPKKVIDSAVMPADLTSRMSNLSSLAKTGNKSDIDNTNVRKEDGGVYRNEGKKVEFKRIK